jgi:hypothetical protein
LGGSSAGGGGVQEEFDVWGQMGGQQDSGAIFVPVDTGAHGGRTGDFGTTSPNGGLQQWVSRFLKEV